MAHWCWPQFVMTRNVLNMQHISAYIISQYSRHVQLLFIMYLSVIWIYDGFSSNVLSEITIPLNMEEASLRDVELVVCEEEDSTDEYHNDHTYDENCGRPDATGRRNFKRKDMSSLSLADQHRLGAEAQRKSKDRARTFLFKQTQKMNAIPGYQCATIINCKTKNSHQRMAELPRTERP